MSDGHNFCEGLGWEHYSAARDACHSIGSHVTRIIYPDTVAGYRCSIDNPGGHSWFYVARPKF